MPLSLLSRQRSRRSRRWLRSTVAVVAVGALAAACGSSAKKGSTSTGSSQSTLTVGTLYAGSGDYSASSLPEYEGLQFWVNQVNGQGGVTIAGKKYHVKLVAYNDQSDPTTAATLYNQLLTQNKVDVFVADFGSVLTAPAITIAKEHHQVLFDPTGSGAVFFSNGANPYVLLTSLPTSAVWPNVAVDFLLSEHVTKVAIIYGTNDFDGSQAATIKKGLEAKGVTPLYYQGVDSKTSDYGTIIQTVKDKSPQAVIELGYENNDIAFLNDLRSAGVHFPFVLTPFPAQLPDLFAKDVGTAGLAYTFAYGVPPVLQINNVNYGMGFTAFSKAFSAAHGGATLNFLDVAGYNAGLVIQDSLAHAKSTKQLDIRAGAAALSGKLRTLMGSFVIDDTGEQLGELLPVAQYFPNGGFKIVYPADQATTKPVYPAPAS